MIVYNRRSGDASTFGDAHGISSFFRFSYISPIYVSLKSLKFVASILMYFNLTLNVAGLFSTALIILFAVKAEPSATQALLVNNLDSAGFFTSTATSLTATFLIAYRIWSLSKNGLS